MDNNTDEMFTRLLEAELIAAEIDMEVLLNQSLEVSGSAIKRFNLLVVKLDKLIQTSNRLEMYNTIIKNTINKDNKHLDDKKN